MFECKCCGTELPDGTKTCPQCLLGQEPTPKFHPGQLVKLARKEKGVVYYNHVLDSYFNHEADVHMYRLAEFMAMPVYREDWLVAVDEVEVARIIESGKLICRQFGGFEYPIEQEVPGNEEA